MPPLITCTSSLVFSCQVANSSTLVSVSIPFTSPSLRLILAFCTWNCPEQWQLLSLRFVFSKYKYRNRGLLVIQSSCYAWQGSGWCGDIVGMSPCCTLFFATRQYSSQESFPDSPPEWSPLGQSSYDPQLLSCCICPALDNHPQCSLCNNPWWYGWNPGLQRCVTLLWMIDGVKLPSM